jgi:hypothetical protein
MFTIALAIFIAFMQPVEQHSGPHGIAPPPGSLPTPLAKEEFEDGRALIEWNCGDCHDATRQGVEKASLSCSALCG